MTRAEIEAIREQIDELGSLSVGNTRRLLAAYDRLAAVLDELLACNDRHIAFFPPNPQPRWDDECEKWAEEFEKNYERTSSAWAAAREARNATAPSNDHAFLIDHEPAWRSK